MDQHLKRLADISMALEAAEEALAAGASTTARERLDEAAEGLDGLRAAWPGMTGGERAVVGRTARPLRLRLDAGRRGLPRSLALTDVPEDERTTDAEQDAEPEGPDAPPAVA
jgi:hypothetical protein